MQQPVYGFALAPPESRYRLFGGAEIEYGVRMQFIGHRFVTTL